jgi:glucans biosynthesis protein
MVTSGSETPMARATRRYALRAPRISRRHLLTGVACATLLPASTMVSAESGADMPAAFSFDSLTEEMRQRAASPDSPATLPDGVLSGLSYDDYRLIRFRTERARWQGEGAAFHLHPFHLGWLFTEPVLIFEVVAGEARPMTFTTADFEYLDELAARVPAGTDLPGVAGFRLNHPLNRPDRFDELVAFLGASYFRALGRGSAYGISARGLAINTARGVAEEFPRFSRFWIERDPAGGATITVHAALESASVTGAFRFVIRPGAMTEMDVTTRLFFRSDVEEVGIAPLTSMFLFADVNRGDFDDYRPAVHDSDGLGILRASGEMIWRPLNNPPQLANSYFAETAPRKFGLYQRDRAFESYQDLGARYERRPSLEVEPQGDWGAGAVRLVEIPSDLEANDNIVAFWVPQAPVRAGEAREFTYRLRWGDLPPDPFAPRAHVRRTAAGAGGVSGVAAEPDTRKFVIDFAGGQLAGLPPDADIAPVVTVTGGELTGVTLDKVSPHDIWRVVIDLRAAPGAVVEIGLHVAGYGQKLTEDWLYQWLNL